MDAYRTQYEKIISDAGDVSNDTVAALFLDMKLSTLLHQAKKDLGDIWHQPSVPDNVGMRIRTNEKVHLCPTCRIECFIDEGASSATCPQCAVVQQVVLESVLTHSERSCYNQAARHVYAKKEHFFQTLLDISCMGKRHIPPDVFNYCLSILGRNRSISFRDVFRVLQIGGYSKYYCIKYNIAAGLRGRPEINLTIQENYRIRSIYLMYDKHFVTFQTMHKLGKRGKSGRVRLFWPVRFIMGEIFKMIGRHDLVPLLKRVVGPDRYERYKFYWDKLDVYVNRTPTPPKRSRPLNLQLTRLSGKQKPRYPLPRRPRPSSSS